MAGVADAIRPMPLRPLPENPLVSVLMANYNYGRFIGEAIESVLAQTYTNWELIICDDGSTDNSCEVVEQYRQRDSRIKLIRKENGGQASALNRAYSAAKGAIICLLDADDLFEPAKIETVVNAFRASPTSGFLIHPVLRVDARGVPRGRFPVFQRMPSGWLAPSILINGGMTGPLPGASGLSLRREVAEKVFPLNESFTTNADGVIQRLAVLITEICLVDRTLTRYRLHGANLTNSATVSTAVIEREMRISEKLHREQQAYLGRFGLSDLLAPIQESYFYKESAYVLSRLKGEQRSVQMSYHRALIYHPSFHKRGPGKWLFLAAPFLPLPVFIAALNLLYGQGRVKQVFSNLQKFVS